MKKKLRIIALILLVIALIFVGIALSCPTLGSVFYIGNIRIGVEELHRFYDGYVISMIGLLVVSFFIKDKE